MEELISIVIKQIVITLISLTLGGASGYLVTKYKNRAENAEQARLATELAMERKSKALEDGLQALLRDRILRLHKDCKEAGHTTVLSLDNLQKLYASYHALGGNGTITQVKEEMEKLPVTG